MKDPYHWVVVKPSFYIWINYQFFFENLFGHETFTNCQKKFLGPASGITPFNFCSWLTNRVCWYWPCLWKMWFLQNIFKGLNICFET